MNIHNFATGLSKEEAVQCKQPVAGLACSYSIHKLASQSVG